MSVRKPFVMNLNGTYTTYYDTAKTKTKMVSQFTNNKKNGAFTWINQYTDRIGVFTYASDIITRSIHYTVGEVRIIDITYTNGYQTTAEYLLISPNVTYATYNFNNVGELHGEVKVYRDFTDNFLMRSMIYQNGEPTMTFTHYNETNKTLPYLSSTGVSSNLLLRADLQFSNKDTNVLTDHIFYDNSGNPSIGIRKFNDTEFNPVLTGDMTFDFTNGKPSVRILRTALP